MTDEPGQNPDVDLSDVAGDEPQDSVAQEEDAVQGEPGWAPEGDDPQDGAH